MVDFDLNYILFDLKSHWFDFHQGELYSFLIQLEKICKQSTLKYLIAVSPRLFIWGQKYSLHSLIWSSTIIENCRYKQKNHYFSFFSYKNDWKWRKFGKFYQFWSRVDQNYVLVFQKHNISINVKSASMIISSSIFIHFSNFVCLHA